MTDEEKERPERLQPGLKTPLSAELEPLPPDTLPGGLFDIFKELKHRTAVDAAELLTRTTGGRTFGVLKQSALGECHSGGCGKRSPAIPRQLPAAAR